MSCHNFELHHFKVGAVFETQSNTGQCYTNNTDDDV